MRRIALVLALTAAFSGAAAAADRVALVDDVAAPSQKRLAAFDYLEKGRVIALAPGERISIAYLTSCVTEKIVGGRITIGEQRSTVEGGTVERGRVPCDSGRLRLTASSASGGGAMIFRDPPIDGKPAPRLRVYGSAPIVDVGPRVDRMTIERLDVDEPRLAERLTVGSALKSGVHDLARLGVTLVPGGLYRLVAGGKELVIAIAREVEDVPRSALSRFVPFRDFAETPPKPEG